MAYISKEKFNIISQKVESTSIYSIRSSNSESSINISFLTEVNTVLCFKRLKCVESYLKRNFVLF